MFCFCCHSSTERRQVGISSCGHAHSTSIKRYNMCLYIMEEVHKVAAHWAEFRSVASLCGVIYRKEGIINEDGLSGLFLCLQPIQCCSFYLWRLPIRMTKLVILKLRTSFS